MHKLPIITAAIFILSVVVALSLPRANVPLEYKTASEIIMLAGGTGQTIPATIIYQNTDEPVNNITTSIRSSYSYQLTQKHFGVYFKNNSNTDSSVLFVRDGFSFIYDVSAGEMLWKEKPGQPAAWNTLGSGNSSNSQNTQIETKGATAIYSAAFSNTDINYTIENSMLKETYILHSLPSIKDYTYLEYSGNVKFNASLQVCTNEVCYTPSGTEDDFNTTGQIDFMNGNTTVFYLKAPVIHDSAGHTTTGMYKFHGSNAQGKFYLRINTDWISTATFPIYIDPTVMVYNPVAVETTQLSSTKNIARNESGALHVTFTDAANDLWHAWSTDEGASWTTEELYTDSDTEQEGIVINKNNDIFIYFLDVTNYQLKIMNKSFAASGVAWSSPTIVSLGISNGIPKRPAAVSDSQGIIHLIYVNDTSPKDNLWYVNNSAGNFANRYLITNDVWNADIEVDENDEVYIVSYGASRNFDIWRSSVGWGNTNNVTIYSSSSPHNYANLPKIAVSSNNNIFIGGTLGDYSNQTVFCNSTTAAIANWNCKIISQNITVATGQNVDIITKQGTSKVYMMYNSPSIYDLNSYQLSMANSTWPYAEWSNDTMIARNATYPSIQGTLFPTFNRVNDTLRYVYTMTNSSNVVYQSKTLSYYSPTISMKLNSSDSLNRTNASMTIVLSYFSPDGNMITTNFTEWFKDGARQIDLANSSNMSDSFTTKGEVWNATLMVYDGFVWSSPMNASILINNSAPSITAPEINVTQPIANNEDINCTGGVYSDNDNDAEDARYYRWFNNTGEIIKAQNKSYLRKGNITSTAININCSIRVSDGTVLSDWANSTNNAEGASLEHPTSIINCQNLAANTNNILINDVSSTSSCMIVMGHNVTLDCQGYKITYGTTTLAVGYAIRDDSYANLTIRNCNILQGSARTDGNAINLGATAYNITIRNNTISTIGTTARGIFLSAGTYNVTVIGNKINTTGTNAHGILLNINNFTNIQQNTFNITRSFPFNITGSVSNNFNTTITNTNTENGAPILYFYNETGTTHDGESFSQLIVLGGNNTNFTNVNATQDGIFVLYSNNVIIRNISFIMQKLNAYGVYVGTSTGIKITSNFFNTTSSTGSYIIYTTASSARTSTLANTFTSNQTGGYIYYGTGSNEAISKNNITSNTLTCMYILGDNGNITSNICTVKSSAGYGIYFSGATPKNNSIWNNLWNMTRTTSPFFASSGSPINIFNTTKGTDTNIANFEAMGGNAYATIANTGYSQKTSTCADVNKDMICDASYAAYGVSPNTRYDYLPLSLNYSGLPYIRIVSPLNNSYVNGNVYIVTDTDAYNPRSVAMYYKYTTNDPWIFFCNATSASYNCYWNTTPLTDAGAGYYVNATVYDRSNKKADTVMKYSIDKSLPSNNNLVVEYPEGQTSVRDGDYVILWVNTTDSATVAAGIAFVAANLTNLNGTDIRNMTMSGGSLSHGSWSWWNLSVYLNGISTGLRSTNAISYDNATPTRNIAQGDAWTIRVDNETPIYTEMQHTPETPYNNTNVVFSIVMQDYNWSLKRYNFSHNTGGVWVNVSGELSENPEIVEQTVHVYNGTYNYKWYIYDDAGNVNVTAEQTITVLGNEPGFVTYLASPDYDYKTYNTLNNYTFWYENGKALNCSLYINDTYQSDVQYPNISQRYNLSADLARAEYEWYVSCVENTSLATYTSETRDIEIMFYPTLNLFTVFPTYNITVTKDQFFNVTVNVTCKDADCGEVNVSLDPDVTAITEDGNIYYTEGPPPDFTKTYYRITNGDTADLTDVVGGSSSYKPGYIQFDTSSIPDGATITSVTLKVYAWAVWSDQNIVIRAMANKPSTASDADLYTDCNDGTTYATINSISEVDYTLYEQDLGANAVTDLQNLLPSDWFAVGMRNTGMLDDFVKMSESTSDPVLVVEYTGGSSAKGLIPVNSGTPFYTNESNPRKITILNETWSQLITYWVNATGNDGSSYNFFAYANITNNQSVGNKTTVWNVTIQATNNPPTVVGLYINSSDNLNRTNATLNINFSYSDSDGDKAQINFTGWFNNGEWQPQFGNVTNVSHIHTNKSDVWNATVMVFDGSDWSSPVNATILINNTVPNVAGIAINSSDNLNRPNATLNVIWNLTDPDNATDTYQINITGWFKNGAWQAALGNVTNISSSYLAAGDIWNATIMTYDGTSYSNIMNASITIGYYARLNITNIFPTYNITVSHDQLFNYTSQVCCFDNDCGNVNVSLDPETTGYSDPDGDLTPLEWTSTGASHYTEIDETTIQPNLPNTLDYISYSTEEEGPVYYYDTFGMSNLTGIDSVSNITIWVYGYTSDNDAGIGADLNIGGSWQGFKPFTHIFGGGTGWWSVSYSGTWTQTQLNAMQVKLRATLYADEVRVYAMYAEVNYTATSSGKGLISTTAGTTPFYINFTSTRPYNPNTTTLNQNECVNVTWYVNATDPAGASYMFFAYANKTADSEVTHNKTAQVNITIQSSMLCTPDTDCYLDCSLNPSTTEQLSIGTKTLYLNGAGTFYLNNIFELGKLIADNRCKIAYAPNVQMRFKQR